MSAAGIRRLRLGVAGLGRAFTVMLPTFERDPRISLVAAADPRPEARAMFAADFSARAYESVEALCADPAVEIVYVATPHQHHAHHAALVAQHGKHVLVEKPMALTLAECSAMIEAARRANVHLVVGHSHSFDAPITRTRDLIDRGDFGAVRMIHALNYTDFLYRPRRPEELDTRRGGGAVFNQAAHQVDVVRLLAGQPVRRVRAATGAWDRARPTEGAYCALLTFAHGAFASLTYNGYGRFDSDEFMGWVGEMGQTKDPGARSMPRRFATVEDEAAFKAARNYGGPAYQRRASQELAYQHFGLVIVSCDHADLRPQPNGVMIYENGKAHLDALLPPAVPRAEVIDELYDAVVHGRPPRHDGVAARATIEVCLAILESARTGAEVDLGSRDD